MYKTFCNRHAVCSAPADVTNGAIVIHTQRLKSDPGGNLLS
ncbi:chemotaxis protein [Salmonella enterica]|nr:chemotaxis protein [Salmonella enterica]